MSSRFIVFVLALTLLSTIGGCTPIGKQNWDENDAFDFDTGTLFPQENGKYIPKEAIKTGDIYLNFNRLPAGAVGYPERPITIDKINAPAVYDANNKSDINCEVVNYNFQISSVLLVQSDGQSFSSNRTICILTSNRNYAKMIFEKAYDEFIWRTSKND